VPARRGLIRGGRQRRKSGVERVWDYPRPPIVVLCPRRVRIELGGEVLAESGRALRVLETSHPPTIYVPPDDVRGDLLVACRGSSWCEFKGSAAYVGREPGRPIGWTYANPSAGYETLRGHIAFYPGRVDGAWLDDERVVAQPGDFYGGWITSDLVGPFKGPPGTLRW
jgi:uncharacterized protein (DUF427 family)